MDEQLYEERVGFWVRVLQRGGDIPAPVVVRTTDGGFEPLRPEDEARIEAMQRRGLAATGAYVLDGATLTPQRLAELSRGLDRADAEVN